MGEWRIGLSTGCFYRTSILDCLEPIRAAGFSTIEICSYPAHLDYHQRGAVDAAARSIRELHLEPHSFHAPFAVSIDVTAEDPAGREAARRELLAGAEAAAVLGARYFVIHPGSENSVAFGEGHMARLERAVEILDQVARRCRELGIHPVLENMLPHLFAGHVRELLWILGALDSTEVGICLDTGHAYLSGDLHTVVHKLSGHLWMIHASDTKGRYDDHLPPGEGAVPWEALMRQLLAAQFHGTFVIETGWGDDPAAVLEAARRGRVHLQELQRRISPRGFHP